MRDVFHQLLEAARQIAYFDGPTESNLRVLRECVDACTERDRDHGYQDEEDEEDDDEDSAYT